MKVTKISVRQETERSSLMLLSAAQRCEHKDLQLSRGKKAAEQVILSYIMFAITVALIEDDRRELSAKKSITPSVSVMHMRQWSSSFQKQRMWYGNKLKSSVSHYTLMKKNAFPYHLINWSIKFASAVLVCAVFCAFSLCPHGLVLYIPVSTHHQKHNNMWIVYSNFHLGAWRFVYCVFWWTSIPPKVYAQDTLNPTWPGLNGSWKWRINDYKTWSKNLEHFRVKLLKLLQHLTTMNLDFYNDFFLNNLKITVTENYAQVSFIIQCITSQGW